MALKREASLSSLTGVPLSSLPGQNVLYLDQRKEYAMLE